MATNRTTAERIEHQREKMEQAANEMKRLLRLHKSEERKSRTHRICERGGMLEGMLPDTIILSKERFRAFLEKTVANDFGRRTLAALKAEQEKANAESGGDAITSASGADGSSQEPAAHVIEEPDSATTAPQPQSHAASPVQKTGATTPNATTAAAAKAAQPPQVGGAASAAKTPEAIRKGA